MIATIRMIATLIAIRIEHEMVVEVEEVKEGGQLRPSEEVFEVITGESLQIILLETYYSFLLPTMSQNTEPPKLVSFFLLEE